LPSSVATVRPRTRGRGWRAADASGPTGACAYARPRRRVGVGVGVGARWPVDGRRASGLRPVDAQVRRATRVGATVVGAEWRLLRRGYDYPDDTAKAGTRVRVTESGGGVRTSRPVTTEACARCSTGWVVIVVPAGADLVGVDYLGDEAKAGVRVRVVSARGHPVSSCSRTGRGLTARLSRDAPPRGGTPRGCGPGDCGFALGGGSVAHGGKRGKPGGDGGKGGKRCVGDKRGKPGGDGGKSGMRCVGGKRGKPGGDGGKGAASAAFAESAASPAATAARAASAASPAATAARAASVASAATSAASAASAARVNTPERPTLWRIWPRWRWTSALPMVGQSSTGRMPPRGAIRKWIAPRTRRSCAIVGLAARTTHTRNLWRWLMGSRGSPTTVCTKCECATALVRTRVVSTRITRRCPTSLT